MACRAQTDDSPTAEHGSVFGGYVHARERVTVGASGSDAHVPTNVNVGFHPRVLQEAIESSTTLKRQQADFATHEDHACFGDQRDNVGFESKQRR